MATSFQSLPQAHVPSSAVGAGGFAGGPHAGCGDEECFNLELEDPPNRQPSGATHSVQDALELLNSGLPDSVVEGLQAVEHNVHHTTWLQQFLHLDGASLCVELMGCFSAAEVQQASAHVCAELAGTGPEACMALLDADVASMLQQHIKSGETTLRMFEDAANILSAIASSAGEAGHALTQLGIMAHLCGMLARPGDEARAARTAALAAITALCANQRQSQLNLFQYGGVNTLLQTLLQPERGDAEVLAAATLVERILAPMQECRDIMEGVRGIEVLAQVHREAEERGQAALRTASLRALAQLTFRHPTNLAALESDAHLLRHESLYHEVVALHARSQTSPRLFPKHSAAFFSGSLPTLSAITISGEESPSEQGSESPPLGSGRGASLPWGRKGSLDGSARAARRVSSSFKSMMGSVKRLMRSERSIDGTAQAGGGGGTAPLHAPQLSSGRLSSEGGHGGHTARF